MNAIKSKSNKLSKKWKGLSKKKKIISSVIVVVLVCVIIADIVQRGKATAMVMPTAVAQEVTVTVGSISNTIVGTGNLEIDASHSIKLPSGITIKEVKVENGDSVSKGDILAVVDKTSVLEAMESVQEEIEDLDEKINDSKDIEETTSITAKIAGTIKKIYAKEGDSVTDCIAENGALIVIAIDGDSDETIEITASGGTVSEIYVSKNEEVSEGDTLLDIENEGQSTEYKQLMSQRKDLTDSLKALTAMSKNGTIVADIDGIVGSVNVSEGDVNSTSTSGGTSNSSSGVGFASQMSYKSTSASSRSVSKKNSGVTLTTLSTVTRVSETTSDVPSNSETAVTVNDEKIKLQIVDSGKTTKDNLVLEIPKAGGQPQKEIKVTNNSYEGAITWDFSGKTFEAGTTYSADVTLNAKEGYIFAADSITKVSSGLLSGISVLEEGKKLSFHITFPATEEETTKREQNSPEINKNVNVPTEQSESTNEDKQINEYNKVSSENIVSTPISTQSVSQGSSNSTQTVTTSDSDEDDYSSQITAFTLASNDTMLLSVSVDELDINSVEKDQEATITMDAIEDKTFTGTVTKVSNSASSSGNGVAKYTVQISVPKDSEMKAGMNASATIVIENKENILTIPVNALQERGNQSFVYTEKDSEGNLTGEVEVTTGLSDGDNVEITEGLSEGDVVYYQKTGNTSDQFRGNMFGAGNMERPEGMGEMPEGFGGRENSGEMPQMPGRGGN